MKTVFTNDMVCHVWAQQCQPSGRNANSSVFFEGRTIYSYGRHFPIATLGKDKNGRQVALLTNRTYSITTSGHQALVWRAIRLATDVFSVPNPQALEYEGEQAKREHQRNLESYDKRVLELVEQAAKRRKASLAMHDIERARFWHNERNEYATRLVKGGRKIAFILDSKPDFIERIKTKAAAEKEREKAQYAKFQRERIAAVNAFTGHELDAAHGSIKQLSAKPPEPCV